MTDDCRTREMEDDKADNQRRNTEDAIYKPEMISQSASLAMAAPIQDHFRPMALILPTLAGCLNGSRPHSLVRQMKVLWVLGY